MTDNAAVDPMDADTNGLGVEEIEDSLEDLADEPYDLDNIAQYDVETSGPIHLSLYMTVRDPGTLGEAFDSFNASLGRFGTDSFYVIAQEGETGRKWILNGGRVLTEEEVEAAEEDDDDDDED